jgi:hypothetical protein
VGTAETEIKKLEQVPVMLARTVGPGKVEEMLQGLVPHRIEFTNHRSFYENFDFGMGEVRKLVENEAAYIYPKNSRPPKVVNPLGVVNLPKGRLVLNAKYVNAFCRKHGFTSSEKS